MQSAGGREGIWSGEGALVKSGSSITPKSHRKCFQCLIVDFRRRGKKNELRRFQKKSSQVEETFTVEVLVQWLARRGTSVQLMHVCPATFQMLPTWPRAWRPWSRQSFRPPVECKTVSGGPGGQSGGWAELISLPLLPLRPYLLLPYCYLCFPRPVFSPPSSVSSLASLSLFLFLPSAALCLCDPFPWPRPH